MGRDEFGCTRPLLRKVLQIGPTAYQYDNNSVIKGFPKVLGLQTLGNMRAKLGCKNEVGEEYDIFRDL